MDMDRPQDLGTELEIELETKPDAAPPAPPPETKRSLPADDDNDDSGDSRKRTKTTAQPANIEAENALLLELKDGQNLGWPAIAEAFQQHGWAGRKLKNRYRSLKDGTVFWEDSDVDCMHQAIFQVEREYERTRWDCVAQRMAGLGASRKFTGAACEKKFRVKAKNRKDDVPAGDSTVGEGESLQ